jgi:hypothetical protein
MEAASSAKQAAANAALTDEALVAGVEPGCLSGLDSAAAAALGVASELYSLASSAPAECCVVWTAHCDRIRRSVEAAAAAGPASAYAAALHSSGVAADCETAVALSGKRHAGWPSPSELELLRLVSLVYPVTDTVHPVTRAASIALAQALTCLPIATAADCHSALHCSALLIQMHAPARRLPLEALTTITSILAAASGTAGADALPASLVALAGTASGRRQRPLAWVAAQLGDKRAARGQSASAYGLVRTACCLLSTAGGCLAAVAGVAEALSPAAVAVEALATKCADKGMQAELEGFASSLGDVVERCLRRRAWHPLALQQRQTAPQALAFMEPEFEEDFDPDRKRTRGMSDARREKEEVRLLQKQHRREMRGAARELRLDAQSIAAARDQRRLQRQEAHSEQQREMRTFLEEQAASANEAVRGGLARGGGAASTKAERKARKGH